MNGVPNYARRFEGKSVLVLGGGIARSGEHSNGSAAAVAYAREGAHVAVVDLVETAAMEVVRLIESAGGRGVAIRADAGEEASVREAVQSTVDAFGRIDVLHNNVGFPLMGLPPELALEDWDRSFSVNVGSVFLSSKYVLPIMVAQHSGAIVNISSLASLRETGYPYPAYSASKAAVNQLTVSLALQYARSGIRVNAVAPGIIHSPLIYRDISAQYDSVEEMVRARDEMTPNGKMGTPWDVAEASLFLASDAAAFINGVILPVDGGQHMRVS
ncbi:SDR family oxidoreductase [Microbacterium aoyamense]|uniref:SDR family oxidoreductase n=1 Tax=Microbacterium aoyamense TaxID=344166 RepID=A0ABN2PCU9_9MICO|nr:SDR family NAD(P)-dependent oxidoreductase [Microbacterium aoyamense]